MEKIIWKLLKDKNQTGYFRNYLPLHPKNGKRLLTVWTQRQSLGDFPLGLVTFSRNRHVSKGHLASYFLTITISEIIVLFNFYCWYHQLSVLCPFFSFKIRSTNYTINTEEKKGGGGNQFNLEYFHL